MKKYLIVPTKGSSYTVEAASIDYHVGSRLIFLRDEQLNSIAIMAAENVISVSEFDKTKDL